MKAQIKYLITYDIKDNKRRCLVANELQGYGRRIQYSVFECFLSDSNLKNLVKKIEEIIDKDDNVRIYPINKIRDEEIIEIGKKLPKYSDYLVV